jgi:hypothetical protein
MRQLSSSFMNDLIEPSASLFPVLARLKVDQTLMLAIRDGYINIYYRGGNLLRVREMKGGVYEATFDENYNVSGKSLPVCPREIQNPSDVIQWVESFSQRKEVMDEFLSQHDKSEREFQQLVARENNASVVSNQGEYFVVDIEASYPALGARFDILAIRWLANQRQSTIHCKPALIEMKYGDGALGGTSGIVKHLQDLEALITNRERYAALLESMSIQFEQLYELGLIKFNRSINSGQMILDINSKPEVIFLLANHNPRSTNLNNILKSSDIVAYQHSELFDLRFFVSSFSGYTMHSQNMKILNEFLELL